MQMEELEHGQILERGTVSLPTMQSFRQDLLKGAPPFVRPTGGDLANWQRPSNVTSEDAPVSLGTPCSCCVRLIFSTRPSSGNWLHAQIAHPVARVLIAATSQAWQGSVHRCI